MESDLSVGTEWVWERIRSEEPLFFIELRHPGDVDFTLNKVRGALRVSSDDAKRHLAEIPRERVVVVCSAAPNDEPAFEFARRLVDDGFRARVLTGGVMAYLAAGLPVEEVARGRDMTRLRGY